MRTSDARVTARMRRTESGEVLREYIVDGVAYGSIDAVKTALGGA
ncbi:hypothetical protein C499_19600 [Halogeometricum borinquense DSM 11551]|uniref:Uncharacterized protein n=1 Tax=Halogeometricum borinquense (strain ATCC 700274 / DSM 11551 / JCM 10706 / KCTC 4070 / PR3) TaxID=469382 RepID=E4NWT9_HALBP|nr:hypothetical protein [Halogeometricum borinquense]ADQ69509.1 hypothetical protein Hbor_38040 [Halogeometricum borinquense DSM 11551]ELY23060.1 hypothetical protein C499_19600 [Halogeometricum borinquense DSM 11551]